MDIYHVAEIEDYLKEELCELVRARLTPIMLKKKNDNYYRVKSGAPDLFVDHPYQAQEVMYEDWYLQVFYCADKEVAVDANGPLILPGFMLGGTPCEDSLIVFYKPPVDEDWSCAFVVRGLNVHDIVIRTRSTWYCNIIRENGSLTRSMSRAISSISTASTGAAYSARSRPPNPTLRDRRLRKRSGGCFSAIPKCLDLIDERESSIRTDSRSFMYSVPGTPSPKFSNCFNFTQMLRRRKD